MEKLMLWQRFRFEDIVGELTMKEETTRGILYQPVTLYNVTRQDGSIFRAGLVGREYEPEEGDIIRIRIDKKNDLLTRVEDGNRVVYKQIKEYEVIKENFQRFTHLL